MRIVMRFVHHHMRACLPNVSHWANETHPRHGAGFYYGVPWRDATRTNVFCPTFRFFALMKRGDWTPIIFITTSDSLIFFYTSYVKEGMARKHCDIINPNQIRE